MTNRRKYRSLRKLRNGEFEIQQAEDYKFRVVWRPNELDNKKQAYIHPNKYSSYSGDKQTEEEQMITSEDFKLKNMSEFEALESNLEHGVIDEDFVHFDPYTQDQMKETGIRIAESEEIHFRNKIDEQKPIKIHSPNGTFTINPREYGKAKRREKGEHIE